MRTGSFFSPARIVLTVTLTCVSVTVGAGWPWGKNEATKELERLGGGFRVVSPCDVLTAFAWQDETRLPSTPEVLAFEFEGFWIGGPWRADEDWAPALIELSCAGTHLPLKIENNTIGFPLEEDPTAQRFIGVPRWGKLVGSIEGETNSFAVFYPLKENPFAATQQGEDAEGHSTGSADFPSVILDGANGSFASVFHHKGNWYFFDGTTLSTAWVHRERGLVSANGNYIEKLFEVEKKEFQISVTTPQGIATHYPTWVPIVHESKGGLNYYPALPEKETPLVLMDETTDSLLNPVYREILIQFFVRHGFSVISAQGKESTLPANERREAVLRNVMEFIEQNPRHQAAAKLIVGGVDEENTVADYAALKSFDGAFLLSQTTTTAEVDFTNLPGSNGGALLWVERGEEEFYTATSRVTTVTLADVDASFRRNVKNNAELNTWAFSIDQQLLGVIRDWSILISFANEEKSPKLNKASGNLQSVIYE